MSKLISWLYDKQKATKRLKVACIAMQCNLEPDQNYKRMVEWIATVIDRHPDVELILFGETVLGWYAKRRGTKEYHQSIGDTIPGETTQMMADVAQKNGIYLCFGMTESNAGEIFNTQVLISPRGEILAAHRKFHLMESAAIFKPGKLPATIVDIKGIRAGIIVCSDIQNSFVRRALKTSKVELILGGLANPKDPEFFVSGMIAKLFDSWIVTANRYGEEDGYFYGGDMIISNPLGQLHRTAVGKEQFICEKIFFVTNESIVKQRLRRIYVGISFIPFLFKHIRLKIQKNSKSKVTKIC